MDWIGLQLIGTLLMIACYLYADRHRLRRGIQHWRYLVPQTVLHWVATLCALRDGALPRVEQTRRGRTPTLDLHAPTSDGTAPAGDWLRSLNHYPDRYPHLLVIGPTGSGKTTFVMALLADRPGRIAVLTPKPDPDDWPGVPIVTIDDDGAFSALSRAFATLDREVKNRLVAAKHRQPIADTLTIVCDDWPVLASECGRPASDLFKLVGRLGRSLQVRLIVLSQSKQVKSLGLDGEGDAITNFSRITLSPAHRASIQLDGGSVALDTQLVPQLAAQPTDPHRWWRPERTEEFGDSSDVDRLLRGALDNDTRNAATQVAPLVVPIATPETLSTEYVAQRGVAPANEAELLPPDVAQQLNAIDWHTVAEMIAGGIGGETAALKSLGFSAGSASVKYQAARIRLQAARQKRSETA